MKEELKQAATEYGKLPFYGDSAYNPPKMSSFTDGAEWILSQYNGISPDTVKEMYEALKELRDLMEDVRTGDYTPDSFTNQGANSVLYKAEQELKKQP